MPSGHKGGPPPYNHGSRHHSRDLYGERSRSFREEEFLHFYRWTSPPGVMKIVSIIIIILCVAIFACVASTLAWETDLGLSGLGGGMGGIGGYGSSYGGGYGGGYGGSYGGGYGSYGGSGIGSSSYGYGGIGGNYTDPAAGKGFLIALAAITFLAVLVIFILVVSRQNISRSRRFYLAVIIVGAILAILMFIATIVYLVAVNPTAQASGSVYYNQVVALCAQYQNQGPEPTGIFINQYLYHYCVVEPQEAIAIVFGVLVVIGLIILVVFAAKTRAQIRQHGKANVLWEEVKLVGNGTSHDVGEWVNKVSEMPEVLVSDYPDNIGGSRNFLDNTSFDYAKPPYTPVGPEQDAPLYNSAPYSNPSDIPSSAGKLKKNRYNDGGYTTGGESGDELDDTDFDDEFPTILTEQDRLDYKRTFEKDLLEYKDLQSELDDINRNLSKLDKQLNSLHEGSPQYLDTLDEYNHLRNLKKSSNYQLKKKRSKYLKAKLAHIKKKVSDYDRRA
ncbi:occludin b [Anguilla anguilla]|uniref:occludin b n=1 Tax=Anguilla anguilla TaxID=7936 RepID=UPI0015B078F2|nr:occludin b [Anguilla anguilla]